MSTPTLVARGMGAGYGRHRVPEDVALRVEPGQVFALLGRNGTGAFRGTLRLLAGVPGQTVRQLMAAAVEEPLLRPGMVSVVQTFGDRVNPHPHVHALVSRGGWTRDDRFVPIPYVDTGAAERLFRHEVFTFLLREELISIQRVELLSSWRHSGFSVHTPSTSPPVTTRRSRP